MTSAFLPLLANHLWQSTAFAGAAALLTLLLRRNRAEVRYRIWQVASLKFLIPFSLLLAAGHQVELRPAASIALPLTSAVQQIGRPFASHDLVVRPSVQVVERLLLPLLLIAAWACGFIVVAGRWWIRWRRMNAVLRTATPLPIEGPITVMFAPTRVEPGIFGILRPVLLLPEGIETRLTSAQFEAVLAHEFCHVRRRDNISAAMHMVVETVFWFHPMVWWLGSRLIVERETSCDEDVLQGGSEPEIYAAGILSVCRHYLESPLACAPGITGADLKKRIEAIMTTPILAKLSLPRKLLLAATATGAVAGPFVFGMMPQQKLQFEVATIKPAKSEGGKGGMEVLPGGGLRLGGVSLKNLVSLAYGVRESDVSGGPAWVASDVYSILAKPEKGDGTDEREKTAAPGTPAWDRMQQRLQSLLEDRFQLVVQKDSKEVSGYALVPAKGGTKLKPSEQQGPARTMRSRGAIEAHSGSMTMLAAVLTNFLGRPVADRSGLSETYDYKLEYTQPEPNTEPSDVSGPSIFTALQEQLGLKLESAKVSNTVLVIVRAEKPSGN